MKRFFGAAVKERKGIRNFVLWPPRTYRWMCVGSTRTRQRT